MKKSILTIALSLCFSYIAMSQAKIEIGLKGGLNFANVNAETVAGYDYKSATGFNVGPYLLLKVLNIGIQPEVLYSAQGTDVETAINGVNYTLEQRYSYLNVPVMLKFYLPLGLNLQAGPQFGFLVDATGDQLSVTSGNTTVSRDADVKDQLKGADISAAVGLGWDTPIKLKISARYVIGLSNVNDMSGGSDTKNRTFQVALGIPLFKIGR